MITTNANVRTLWIEALRSGEYKQTREYLHNPQGYCCLGVLCDIFRKQNPSSCEWVLPQDKGSYVFSTNEEEDGWVQEESYPPILVRDWAGLSYSNMMALAKLNDDDHFTFNEIANVLEENTYYDYHE